MRTLFAQRTLARAARTLARIVRWGRAGPPRGLALAAIALLAVAAGVTAYTATLLLRDTEPAAKASGAVVTATVPSGAQTPRPVETVPPADRPDTSVPNWGAPLVDKEIAKPRYPQTINGIELDPLKRDPSVYSCQPGEAKYVPAAVGDASPLAIRPSALPATAKLDTSLFYDDVECGGRLILVSRFFIIPPAPDALSRIASGVSWFDVEHGGLLWVQRYQIRAPRWEGSEVPSDQWSAATVAGLPAAVGKPILPGFSHSSVVVWDANSGVLTAIRATDRPIEEVLAVAEEVVR